MFPPVSLYSGFVQFSGRVEEQTEEELRSLGSSNFTKSVSLSLVFAVPGFGV